MRMQIIIVLSAALIFFMGYEGGKGNQTLTYGDTGFPKNCRAIVAENINGYRYGEFSAEDALSSINRNCGEFGYSWDNR